MGKSYLQGQKCTKDFNELEMKIETSDNQSRATQGDKHTQRR